MRASADVPSRLAAAAFLLFLVKGLLWILVPAVLYLVR
jgi:hypothetical protein